MKESVLLPERSLTYLYPEYNSEKMAPARQIVFINQATGYLTIDILNAFVGYFDEVVLITGSVRVQDTPLDHRIKLESIVRYNRGSNFKKMVSWMVASIQVFRLLKFRYNSYDKFFFTVPPTAYLMAPWFRGKYSILVFDLYPDALKANGFSEKGLLCRRWSRRNQRVFMHAHMIYTLSDAMRTGINSYAPDSAITVIPNWSAFSHLKPIPKERNNILKRDGLQNKFIVQYSGNIGVTHNVETLLDVANTLREETDIIFQIIGRGERSNEISRRIKTDGLTNCLMLPFRDDSELYESLCEADIAVIILDDKTPDVSIPSKIYNIMAAGLPVLAIASPDSGIGDLIRSHKIGEVFEKTNINDMCQFIRKLKHDSKQRSLYSSCSLEASGLFTSKNAEIYLGSYIDNE